MAIFNSKPSVDPKQARLDELKSIVSENVQGWMQAGLALNSIRTEKLYKLTHTNFAAFVEANWGMGVVRAYQLIHAADAADTVKNSTQQPNASQAEQLAKVPAEHRAAAWNDAITTAPTTPTGTPNMTAAHVADIASKYKARPKRSRVKKPARIVLRGKGWKITIERTTLHVDAIEAIDAGRVQLIDKAGKRSAA